ncbi:conjugal transfer protein TraJ, partial [Escherichia coli]|nr:conjugal transfer protein TraJ [Escherichia coli]EGD4833502.1 conjugal transfer protein TraJ [Escherichia coli]
MADAGSCNSLHRLSIESLLEVPMCALDRRERPLNSQSVNKYILNVQ